MDWSNDNTIKNPREEFALKRIISLCLIILIVLSTACVGSAASDKETVSILPSLEEAFGVGLPSFDNMYLKKLTGTET